MNVRKEASKKCVYCRDYIDIQRDAITGVWFHLRPGLTPIVCPASSLYEKQHQEDQKRKGA